MTLSYQWKKNGAVIEDATSSTLVLSDLDSDDSGSYTVSVTESDSGRTVNAVAKAITIAVILATFQNASVNHQFGSNSGPIATTLEPTT